MKLSTSLFFSSAIAVGMSLSAITPSDAQTAPQSTPANSPDFGFVDFKLTPQQQRAIATISDFALDQMETMVTNGLNPKKLDRVEVQQQAASVRQVLSELQLSDQQKNALRSVLQTAREQIRRQMGTR